MKFSFTRAWRLELVPSEQFSKCPQRNEKSKARKIIGHRLNNKMCSVHAAPISLSKGQSPCFYMMAISTRSLMEIIPLSLALYVQMKSRLLIFQLSMVHNALNTYYHLFHTCLVENIWNHRFRSKQSMRSKSSWHGHTTDRKKFYEQFGIHGFKHKMYVHQK